MTTERINQNPHDDYRQLDNTTNRTAHLELLLHDEVIPEGAD